LVAGLLSFIGKKYWWAWKINKPVNLTLDGWGNTEVRKAPAKQINN
jgi:hypothetical protein